MDRRKIVMICALAITLVLGTQLLAVTAWTADAANQGPGIVILQLSGDSDAKWAVDDLIERLSGFISDDLFFPDRIRVVRTDDPHVAEQLDCQIVIYVSHGGPLGIVTGRYITSWKTMARIVTESKAIMHLFTACASRNIIRHGNEDSGKKLYTVPGARPAEVTNIEVVTTIMLALVLDADSIEEYRTAELTEAKEIVQSGQSVHIMDFEQIILAEIDNIDNTYSDTYTDYHRVYRYSEEDTLASNEGFNALPFELRSLIMEYYQAYWYDWGFSLEPCVRLLTGLAITYTRNYYYEADWEVIEDPPDPPPDPPPDIDSEPYSETYAGAAAATGGFWVYGPHIFCGGTYSGVVVFTGDGSVYNEVVVNVAASGSTLDEVDSISLDQTDPGCPYVSQQKVDGIWEEPVTGRNPYRTGGLWTDSAIKADYEYDPSWPEAPYLHASIKENAEDGDTNGWYVYDNSPAGYIDNVFSNGDRAISLVGGGTGTGYIYPYPSSIYWNDAEHKSIQWSMKYSQSYTVYVSVDTTAGHRYIYYTSANYDSLGTGGYVHHGLGSWTRDGKWHTFTRNLEADLHDAQPSVDIIDINAFLIRGTGQVDDIMLLDTDYEASGAIHSNGEYIYVNSIPIGSGWHGPSFVRTLPSYFKMKDMGSFSANLSLVHGGSNNRLSSTQVNLYDENRKIAVSLEIGDYWGGEQKQRLRARYYREDGSYKDLHSAYTNGDYSGVAQIRYDPLQGIIADVPGESQKVLYLYDQINGERLIKYVAIQSYRYSNLDEHDERIYNIRLSYAGSEYTVFHDNCNDMDGFHKDLGFGYGVPSEGEFIVPTGASYMTPTDIPSSPSGWHGPNFVHVLDRPFRLYQLSEFSVIGQLIQSSYTMGKTYVALFDENKQIVMLIHWGDSWVGTKKGYFNVYFYPQNGGGYAQASGYLYSSFEKTGKLWWDEWQGGDGAIYSSIDGSGDVYPIGECDNASRVIKYVMLLGYKYSHYNLVDMRIHDINVVADLTALDPSAPTKHDGTDIGAGPGPADELNPASQQFADQNFIVQWLQSWWPTLEITVNAVQGICSFVLHLTVDILGAVNVFLSDYGLQGFDFDDPTTAQRIAQQVEEEQINTAETGFALAAATVAVVVSSWLVINWATFAIFCVALGVWSACMFAHLWALYSNYAKGYRTVRDTMLGIFACMMGWGTKLLGFLVRESALGSRVQGILEKIFGKMNVVAMAAAKWVKIAAAIFWILAMVYEIYMISITQPLDAVFQVPSWVT